jgi:hypothetical protein
MIEILFTVAIIGFAAYIIYKNFRKKSAGECGCGNCSKSKKKI